MIDLTTVVIYGLFVIILILIVFIIFLFFERGDIIENSRVNESKLLDELSKAIKAVISKNANDYVMTTSIDKIPKEVAPPPDPDEIPEEALSDDQFFEGIGKSLKEDKKK